MQPFGIERGRVESFSFGLYTKDMLDESFDYIEAGDVSMYEAVLERLI